MIVHRVNTGRKIITDWLGKGGKPVDQSLAQSRADICLECEHNYHGSWLYSMATQLAINSQSKLRAAMNLNLNGEENLHICDKCGCQLKLKVHVPFEHLYAHTEPEQLAKYPDFCWQSIELKKLQSK